MSGPPPFLRGPRGIRITPRSASVMGITGTVTEANGSVVSGAIVDLFDDATRAYLGTTTTNASGVYTFSPLNNAKAYRVNVKHPTLDEWGIAGGLIPS